MPKGRGYSRRRGQKKSGRGNIRRARKGKGSKRYYIAGYQA